MNESISIIGVFITICLIIFTIRKYYQKLDDPVTDAVILKSKIIKDDGEYKTYRLTVKYTVDDKEYINKVIKEAYKTKYTEDDKVVINYKKENPNIIEIEVLRNYPKDGESQLLGMISVYFCLPLILIVLVSAVGGSFNYFMES